MLRLTLARYGKRLRRRPLADLQAAAGNTRDEHPEPEQSASKRANAASPLLRPGRRLLHRRGQDGRVDTSALRRTQEPLKRNAGRAQNFPLVAASRPCCIRSRSSMRPRLPACPPGKTPRSGTARKPERNALAGDALSPSSGVAVEHREGRSAWPTARPKMPIKVPHPGARSPSSGRLLRRQAARRSMKQPATASREARQPVQTQTLDKAAVLLRRCARNCSPCWPGRNSACPCPTTTARPRKRLKLWNQTFSGGDVAEPFSGPPADAATGADHPAPVRGRANSRAARWFPRPEAWPELEAMQKQRDAVTGVSFRENAGSGCAASRARRGRAAVLWPNPSRAFDRNGRPDRQGPPDSPEPRLPEHGAQARPIRHQRTGRALRSGVSDSCTWNWTHDSSPRRALWKIPFP